MYVFLKQLFVFQRIIFFLQIVARRTYFFKPSFHCAPMEKLRPGIALYGMF